MAADDIFFKDIGPLPGWAWAVGIGGGLGFYLYQRRQSATVPANPAVAGSSDTGYGTTSPGIGGSAPTPGMASTVTVPSPPTDNNMWSIKAQNMLVALGYDPATVSIALSNYLGGNNLTAQQQAIVSEALRSAGPTPEPVPPALNPQPTPVPSVPGTVPPPAPAVTYRPPQTGWNAGANVGRQGTQGVGISWEILAGKALSSNTSGNPFNIGWMVREMKKQNPSVAREFPTAVPLYRVPTFIIPKVQGLN